MTLRDQARARLPAPLVLAAMRGLAALRRRQPGAAAALVARIGAPDRVLAGPFAGLCGLQSLSSPLPALLLGSYERELHGAIETLLARVPALVINVGCGEGYYAVGMARRLAGARVLAYDSDRLCRAATARTARLNGAGARVEVRGCCSPAELEGELGRAPGAVVLCDIEGGELELFDPSRVPSLARAALLIEAHEQFVPGIAATLSSRLASTHRITRIEATARQPGHLPPGLPELGPAEIDRALDDGRIGDGLWLLCQPLGESEPRATPEGEPGATP